MNAHNLISREINERFAQAVDAAVRILAGGEPAFTAEQICTISAGRIRGRKVPAASVLSRLRTGASKAPEAGRAPKRTAVLATIDELMSDRGVATGQRTLLAMAAEATALHASLDACADDTDYAAVLLRHRALWGELADLHLPAVFARTSVPAWDDDGIGPGSDRGGGPSADEGSDERYAVGIHLNPPLDQHTYRPGRRADRPPGLRAVWLLDAATTSAPGAGPASEPPTAVIAARQFGRLSLTEHELRFPFAAAVVRAMDRGTRIVHVLPIGSGPVPAPDARADFLGWLLADVMCEGTYELVTGLPSAAPNVIAVEGVGALHVLSDVPTGMDGDGTGDDEQVSIVVNATELAVERPERPARGSDDIDAGADGISTDLERVAVARSKQLWRSVAALVDRAQRPLERRVVRLDQPPDHDLVAFDRSLTAMEMSTGPRILARAGLATTHMPVEVAAHQFAEWHADHADAPDEVHDAIDQLANQRSIRRDALLANAREHDYWDITSEASIAAYLDAPPAGGNPLYGGRYLDRAARMAHVETICSLLETDGLHYRVALVDDALYPLTAHHRHTTWVLTSSPTGTANQVHFIHDPGDTARSTVLASLADGARDRFDVAGTLTRMFAQYLDHWTAAHPAAVDPSTVARRLRALLV